MHIFSTNLSKFLDAHYETIFSINSISKVTKYLNKKMNSNFYYVDISHQQNLNNSITKLDKISSHIFKQFSILQENNKTVYIIYYHYAFIELLKYLTLIFSKTPYILTLIEESIKEVIPKINNVFSVIKYIDYIHSSDLDKYIFDYKFKIKYCIYKNNILDIPDKFRFSIRKLQIWVNKNKIIAVKHPKKIHHPNFDANHFYCMGSLYGLMFTDSGLDVLISNIQTLNYQNHYNLTEETLKLLNNVKKEKYETTSIEY